MDEVEKKEANAQKNGQHTAGPKTAGLKAKKV